MAYREWICTQPNGCKEGCKMSASQEMTGCVFEDEEDIPRDAKIWREVIQEDK